MGLNANKRANKMSAGHLDPPSSSARRCVGWTGCLPTLSRLDRPSMLVNAEVSQNFKEPPISVKLSKPAKLGKSTAVIVRLPVISVKPASAARSTLLVIV